VRIDRVLLDRVQATGARGQLRAGVLAAGLRIQGRIRQAQQVLRFFPGLVPDRGAAHRVRYVAVNHGRGRPGLLSAT